MKHWFMGRKKIPRTLAIAIAAGAMLAVSACSTGIPANDSSPSNGQPIEGGTINIALSGEPTTIDAGTTQVLITRIISNHITERLYALDANLEPQPMLVESHDRTEDGKTYTFVLRDNVFFHDGQPLISDDVVASLERYKELSVRGQGAMKDAKITAVDDQTVTVAFSQPQGNLLSALADLQAPIYPASILNAADPGPLPPEKVIGTGPYMFASWDPGVEIVLSKYENYAALEQEASGLHGKKVAYADELRFVGIADPATRIAALESGQYQFGEGFFGGDDAQLIDSAVNIEASRMRLGKLMMIVNTTLPPLDNPEIRRAIQVGLNIDAFGEVLGDAENWNVAPSILTSDIPISSDAGAKDFNGGDVAEAKKRLAAAGYDGTPITIMTPTVTATETQAVVMQEQLEAMGIETRIDVVELPVMQTRRGDPTSGWNLVSSLMPGRADITESGFLRCGNKYSYMCVAEMDQALDSYVTSLEDDERQDAYNRIQELFYQEVPAYLTAEFWDIYAVHDTLHGFANEVEPVLWNTWITN